MADIARYLQQRFCSSASNDLQLGEIRRRLSFISDGFEAGSEFVVEMIAVSFIENLSYPGEEGSGIVSLLPANLLAELERQRS